MKHFIELKDSRLDLQAMVTMARKAVADQGYIVFRNFHYDLNDLEKTKNLFIQLCEMVGTPISHDQHGSIVWDIKSNPNSTGLVKTYSEHNHKAELHTDSQYSFYPEDMFALLSLQKAKCGGGLSHLKSLKNILNRLKALPDGDEIIRILSNTDFPFIVPNVFKKDISKKYEFNFGPILRNNEIRFRIDTFEKAFQIDNSFCSEEQISAYGKLKKIITDDLDLTEFMMEPGDLIIINNKTMLHGRSTFTDSNRHMLRIRMNKHAKGQRKGEVQ
tara:strand:- start:97 stop:915 length:819 start_codon:yes stop_codon:yes gene_type:complete